MPSERFEVIFRRDLDQLPGLADDEWLPATRRRSRLTVGGVGALTAVALLAVAVGLSLQIFRGGLSLQTPRDDQVTDGGGAGASRPYFIATESAQPPEGTSVFAAGNALTGAPSCPASETPWLAVSFSTPDGQPATGSASAEAAFRKAKPAVNEFKMYMWGVSQPVRGDDPRIRSGIPVWIVAGTDTFLAVAQGFGASNDTNATNWFAYPAKLMGCIRPVASQAPIGR